jgi:hypothetical protein
MKIEKRKPTCAKKSIAGENFCYIFDNSFNIFCAKKPKINRMINIHDKDLHLVLQIENLSSYFIKKPNVK